MLVTGPAGSGKSTTLYACLRHLVAVNAGARSIVSIEDPIEVPVDGVAHSAARRELQRMAMQLGMTCLRDQALRLVQAGRTSPAELVRVLGSTNRG